MIYDTSLVKREWEAMFRSLEKIGEGEPNLGNIIPIMLEMKKAGTKNLHAVYSSIIRRRMMMKWTRRRMQECSAIIAFHLNTGCSEIKKKKLAFTSLSLKFRITPNEEKLFYLHRMTYVFHLNKSLI